MAEEKKKKDRSANFSNAEIDTLCDLIIKYADKIECKKTDAVTWKEKEIQWIKLANEFNISNKVPRTPKCLKTKYETIKKEIRKKAANRKIELFKTGGGTCTIPNYTPTEEKILGIISLSVEGLPSRYDDDEVPSMSNTVSNYCEDHDYINSWELSIIDVENAENVDPIIKIQMQPRSGNVPVQCVVDGMLSDITNNNDEVRISSENTAGSSTWSTWKPTQLRRPVSKALQGKNRKRKLSKPEASEKILMVASSKQKLLDLQYEALLLDMEHRKKEKELQLKKIEIELNNAILDGEIKCLEKKIKIQMLSNMDRVLLH